MPKKRTFYSEEERKAHHEKKQREADLQIQELTKHWENDPKDIAEYLAFSTQFYKYSSRNTMLIYRQRPDSVFIASYTHWKELGYYVQEGEHGANIYRPETTRYLTTNMVNIWSRHTACIPSPNGVSSVSRFIAEPDNLAFSALVAGNI